MIRYFPHRGCLLPTVVLFSVDGRVHGLGCVIFCGIPVTLVTVMLVVCVFRNDLTSKLDNGNSVTCLPLLFFLNIDIGCIVASYQCTITVKILSIPVCPGSDTGICSI